MRHAARGVLAVTAVILFVSWLTALRAARVDVAEALRYE